MKKQLNYPQFQFDKKRHTKKIVSPSLTVPDESFTIKEILQRFTRGVDPMLSKVPLYEHEEEENYNFEIDELRRSDFDLSDMNEVRTYVRELESRLEQQKKQKEEPIKQETT